MGLVIYFTYTPGILEHLKMKRMPGLVLALGVVFLRLYFFAEKIRFLTNKSISRSESVRVALTCEFASAITISIIGEAPIATYELNREVIDMGSNLLVVSNGVHIDRIYILTTIK